MLPAWMINDIKRRDDEDETSEVRIGEDGSVCIRYEDAYDGEEDDVVLETKGGGGYTPPPPPDPMAEARARAWEAEQRAAREEAARLAEEERQRIQLEQDTQKFNTNLGAARNTAYDTGMGVFESMGLLDPRFANALNYELDRVEGTIPFLDPTPGNYFSPDLYQVALDRETDIERTGLRNALNEFAGAGFARDRITNTMDDAILSGILSDQYTTAAEQLWRARNRGQIGDHGFDAGQGILDTQRTAANARLQELGGGVLETGRGELRDIAGVGFDRANAFEFGDPYNVEQTRGQLDTAFGDFSTNLEGSLRNALGGEQLFNIEDILQRSGAAGGLINPVAGSTTNSAILDALARREKEREKGRGIGEQGTF